MSGMVKNMGVEVGIAAPSINVEELFLLPVSMATILNCGGRPTSDKVDWVIYMSGMVKNMGVEVGIAPPSITVKKLFPLTV